MTLHFPEKNHLEACRDIIIEYGYKYQPPMSPRWVENMYSAFELVKLSEASKENFAHAASQIFYKITKNHREPDGNKRSAIICLTVFAILNKKKLNISPDLLEFLALLTAGHPAIIREYVLSLLEDVFEERIHDR